VILDPSLLAWADKLIILVLAVLMFMAARGPRVQTFPSPAPGPAPPPPIVPDKPPVITEPAKPPVVPDKPPIVPDKPPPVVVPPAPAGSDFDRCLAVTLREEGGNDEAKGSVDRTSRGIEQKGDWDIWRQTHAGLPADVFDAPDSEIAAIYKQNYWNPLYCDSLPNGGDLVVFDHGVLAGIGTSAKLLQTIVGADVDGEIGPLTIAAAAAIDPVSLVGRLCDGRAAYYQGLYENNPGRNGIYIKGWLNRVASVRKDALALAAEAPRPKSPVLPSAPNISPPAISPPATGAPWLTLARSLVGTHAHSDNAIIMAWPKAIAAKFPDMADYCARYTHDSVPWCGLTVAYVMAMSGVRPQFGATDTDKFLWADAWRQFGTAVDPSTGSGPQPGDVLVFKWAGGGEHVTLYDHEEDDTYYHCTGGNQGSGHVVSTEAMPMANCIAIRRPA
jgi:lysozyme family protein